VDRCGIGGSTGKLWFARPSSSTKQVFRQIFNAEHWQDSEDGREVETMEGRLGPSGALHAALTPNL